MRSAAPDRAMVRRDGEAETQLDRDDAAQKQRDSQPSAAPIGASSSAVEQLLQLLTDGLESHAQAQPQQQGAGAASGAQASAGSGDTTRASEAQPVPSSGHASGEGEEKPEGALSRPGKEQEEQCIDQFMPPGLMDALNQQLAAPEGASGGEVAVVRVRCDVVKIARAVR